MELITGILDGIIRLAPWCSLVYIVHTVYSNKPNETEITYKDFCIKSKR